MFIDTPDTVETTLAERIRRVRRKKTRRVVDAPTRHVAEASRWAHPR